MRHAGNFNPEWGYIAPAPNFLRTARVFVVAAAIGATASAAVVFSLMDRPAAETSVAARTLVQPVEPALPTRSAPLVAQLQTQSEQTSVFADAARGCGRRDPAARRGRVVHTGASSAVGAASTTQRPPIAAALVEAPRIIMTTEAPPVRVFASEPNTAAAPEAAPVAAAAAAPTPAPRTVIKKPRAVARAAAPPRYDVPRYAAPRYEPRYDSMQRGPYAFLRQYGSYGQEY